MFQNLMILARLGDLRTRPDSGAFPPLVLRCSSGLSGALAMRRAEDCRVFIPDHPWVILTGPATKRING
jgi:hypothetical protein